MAKRAGLPAGQRRTLARLTAAPLPVSLYLADGAAIGHYLGHRWTWSDIHTDYLSR